MRKYQAMVEFNIDETYGWDIPCMDSVVPKWIEGLNDSEEQKGEYIKVMYIKEIK